MSGSTGCGHHRHSRVIADQCRGAWRARHSCG